MGKLWLFERRGGKWARNWRRVVMLITFANYVPANSFLCLPICVPESLDCCADGLEETARCAKKKQPSGPLRDTLDSEIPMCYSKHNHLGHTRGIYKEIKFNKMNRWESPTFTSLNP